MTIYVCEQCNGTGWAKGKRCPCREEDDTAAERRKQFSLLRAGGLLVKTQPKAKP